MLKGIDKNLFIGFCFVFFFLAFSFLVHKTFFGDIDLQTTIATQRTVPRSFDVSLSVFSLLGSVEIVGIILFLLQYLYKKLNLIFVLGSFVLFHLIELFGKFFVNHPSPPEAFFRYDIPFIFPSSNLRTGSSYPSGHSARMAFLLVIVLSLVWTNKEMSFVKKVILTFAFCLLSLVMFVSRIYLGEHWLSDVIGGILLGGGFGLISLGISRFNLLKKR